MKFHRSKSSLKVLGALLLVAGGALGCYNPSVADGGYKCSVGSNLCPDGFMCIAGFCRKPDAGADHPSSTGGAGGAGGGGGVGGGAGGTGGVAGASGGAGGTGGAVVDGGVDTGTDAGCLFTPVAGCTPAAGSRLCDPVCQTGGCSCNDKCSANTLGALTCNAPLGLARRTTGQSCDIQNAGEARQTDNCLPGDVCVMDSCGGNRCYAFCHGDQDCPSSTCSRDSGGGVKICDVPFVTCNPAGQTSGCPTAAQSCYLSDTVADKTLCDCTFNGTGANGSCTTTRDCLGGLVCVDTTGTGLNSRCLRVCTLAGNGGTGCNNGLTCHPFNGSKTYGYCSL